MIEVDETLQLLDTPTPQNTLPLLIENDALKIQFTSSSFLVTYLAKNDPAKFGCILLIDFNLTKTHSPLRRLILLKMGPHGVVTATWYGRQNVERS